MAGRRHPGPADLTRAERNGGCDAPMLTPRPLPLSAATRPRPLPTRNALLLFAPFLHGALIGTCLGDGADKGDPGARHLAHHPDRQRAQAPNDRQLHLSAPPRSVQPGASSRVWGLNCVVVRSKSYLVLRYPGVGRTPK